MSIEFSLGTLIPVGPITEQELQAFTAMVQQAFNRHFVILQRDDNLPPFSGEPHEVDRAVYSAACRQIADVARFTGNLSRISDPNSRRKTAELLRDAFTQLAQDMDAVIAATGR